MHITYTCTNVLMYLNAELLIYRYIRVMLNAGLNNLNALIYRLRSIYFWRRGEQGDREE